MTGKKDAVGEEDVQEELLIVWSTYRSYEAIEGKGMS